MGSGEGPHQPSEARLSFEDASELPSSGEDCLEIYDEAHSTKEDRFIAVGPVRRGIIIVVVYTERAENIIRILSARMATKKEQDRFKTYWRGKHG